ncbi:MAG: hypothetical protein F6K37_34460 [Moorea sp. SIO4E2]|uniref:hypothetical protein n=1 Tax=Moorena sp. SIO4E2 TaxID=2607826 RepID=UPI0013B6C5C9|nr:hypothetical protein [Moorena sp. SIO4E2]NEQ10840.1 hypothetical protein [Moorena sp. SIO4E2]
MTLIQAAKAVLVNYCLWCRLPIPCSRFPIADSRFPFPSWEGLGVGSDSLLPIPVPLLGGVRGGFRFPIPDSRLPKCKLCFRYVTLNLILS